MSTYFGAKCRTCNKTSAFGYNHGMHVILSMIAVAPHAVQAIDADSSGYLQEVKWMADGENVFPFVLEHAGHDLVPADEYGCMYSLEGECIEDPMGRKGPKPILIAIEGHLFQAVNNRTNNHFRSLVLKGRSDIDGEIEIRLTQASDSGHVHIRVYCWESMEIRRIGLGDVVGAEVELDALKDAYCERFGLLRAQVTFCPSKLPARILAGVVYFGLDDE